MVFKKNKIKFYKFFFSNHDKPVIMETTNRENADEMLKALANEQNSLNLSNLIDVRIEMPLLGVSKRKRHGRNFVWVGKDKSQDGWMEESEYKKATN